MRKEIINLTVDAIIIYNNKIALIKRKNPPYKGQYAIPGGFVEIGETVEDAVKREAKEETGLDVEILKLVGVYSNPDRDPRGHTVSICYLCMGTGEIKAGSDADDIKLFSLSDIPKLSFDHNKMIEDIKEDINAILSRM
ncbi:MAG: NUDIX domain-containing protein [Methanosarcinales archaeon]